MSLNLFCFYLLLFFRPNHYLKVAKRVAKRVAFPFSPMKEVMVPHSQFPLLPNTISITHYTPPPLFPNTIPMTYNLQIFVEIGK